jgi:putative peptidoglycan lipid II flippase
MLQKPKIHAMRPHLTMANNDATTPLSAVSEKPATARRNASRPYAFLVASGIFLSRVTGLVRDRVFAHFFGNSDAADAFKAAFRIPNFLQNLFGEGVLSASFIPVYARLLAGGDEAEARRTAGAVAALLALTTSLLVLAGVMATPWLIDAIAPGFAGAKRDLTIRLVRILFPGAGLLVLSAWCLGILNSHRRFFLSYTAPVVWNGALIATLLFFGGTCPQYPLARLLAWGSVAGSALQVGVQLPAVLKLLRRLHLSLTHHSKHVKTVIRNFFPVFIGRGVVQISAYVDALLASLLPTGAVAALAYAQTLYTLPVSLFGMSVSAAELPLMSGELGSDAQVAGALRARLDGGLRRIAFFVMPSLTAFLVLGDVIVAAIYQTGQFMRADVLYVWGILGGYAVGLLASTCGRLYASVFYALHDTRTPLRFAVVRVALAAVLGYASALHLPTMLGMEARWGVAGLSIAAGIAGWIEMLLLRRSLNRRIGPSGLAAGYLAKISLAAVSAAGIGWLLRTWFGHHHPVTTAVVVLLPYGLVYFATAMLLGLPEARALIRRR